MPHKPRPGFQRAARMSAATTVASAARSGNRPTTPPNLDGRPTAARQRPRLSRRRAIHRRSKAVADPPETKKPAKVGFSFASFAYARHDDRHPQPIRQPSDNSPEYRWTACSRPPAAPASRRRAIHRCSGTVAGPPETKIPARAGFSFASFAHARRDDDSAFAAGSGSRRRPTAQPFDNSPEPQWTACRCPPTAPAFPQARDTSPLRGRRRSVRNEKPGQGRVLVCIFVAEGAITRPLPRQRQPGDPPARRRPSARCRRRGSRTSAGAGSRPDGWRSAGRGW